MIDQGSSELSGEEGFGPIDSHATVTVELINFFHDCLFLSRVPFFVSNLPEDA